MIGYNRIIVEEKPDKSRSAPPGDATLLLQRAGSGDESAVSALLPLVYEELRARAGAYFRGRAANQTLQPTALVHEAYLRLVRAPGDSWRDRAHFCAVAATAMRQILVNHATRRARAQQGRAARAMPTSLQTPTTNSLVDVLDLDEALTRLAKLDAKQARIVELRFFGGMKFDEIAGVLKVSSRTIEREWRRVRAWLLRELRCKDTP